MGSDQVIVDSPLCDGTLSSSEFSCAASVFADKWNRFNPNVPPWTWVSSQNLPGLVSNQVEGYLSLDNFCFPKSIELDNGEVDGSCSCDDEELIDDATLVQHHHEERCNYNFHIVYCNSYRVPVLYFRAYSSDGHPLSFDEIKKDLPLYSSKAMSESKWTFITQEEHPYLNRPWYKLHPCGTREWMKLLLLGDGGQAKQRVAMEQYLISWISVVGQMSACYSVVSSNPKGELVYLRFTKNHKNRDLIKGSFRICSAIAYSPRT